MDIILKGNEVYIDGIMAGTVEDTKANYPDLALDIELLWDAIHFPS